MSLRSIMIKESLQEFYADLKPNMPILGIDYGKRKLGFAISDPSRNISVPLEIGVFEKEDQKLAYIISMIDKHRICGLVIGKPVNMDGSESEGSVAIQKFANLLSDSSNLPIFLQDERLSTKAAHSLLISAGVKRKDRDEIDDQISASLILETVIDSMKNL